MTFVIKPILREYFGNFILSHAIAEPRDRWTTWPIESSSFPRYVDRKSASSPRKFGISRRESMIYSSYPFIPLCCFEIPSLPRLSMYKFNSLLQFNDTRWSKIARVIVSPMDN